MRLDPLDRVVVANLLGPVVVDRFKRIVHKMRSDFLAHSRLIILKDSSKDTLGNLVQS